MSRSRVVLLILLVLASFGVVRAQSANAPGLLVYNAWLRPTAPEPAEGATPEAPFPGTVTGAYVTIENTSDIDYRLVGVDVGFAEMSMLHQMSMDDKGVMRMRPLDGLDIPAGTTAQLAPGGYHAMFMNVIDNIYPGQAMAITYTFADADGVTFDVPVGALAMDVPPEADDLIAANALATPNADGGYDISLILDNRGDQADTVIAITSDTGGLVELGQNPLLSKIPALPVDVPAHGAFAFVPEDIFIVTELAQPPVDAFTLTLEFASGKTLTIAVPVTASAS